MSKRRKPPRPSAAGAGGAPARQKVRDLFVSRPFEGLADEPDWIALRELVPAAIAPVRLAPDLTQKYGERSVTVATVLPMAWPALTKPDGRIFVGVQRGAQSGDVSRDLALSILLALETDGAGPVIGPPLPGPGPRLQDVLADGALDVEVRDSFEFWLDDEGGDPAVRASLERANASIFPTVKLAAAKGAYWCRFPEKAHVRWVLSDAEDDALTALSRLAAGGELTLGADTKFAGMFRAHGLLVPVWDLPRDRDAASWEAPLAEFADRYADANDRSDELDAAGRRARQGLIGRQVTLR